MDGVGCQMPNFSDQVMVYDRKKVIGADEPNACAQDAAFVRRGFNFTCSESDRTRRKKWTLAVHVLTLDSGRT